MFSLFSLSVSLFSFSLSFFIIYFYFASFVFFFSSFFLSYIRKIYMQTTCSNFTKQTKTFESDESPGRGKRFVSNVE